MASSFSKFRALLLISVVSSAAYLANAYAVTPTQNATNPTSAPAAGQKSIVLAGGCFWGVEAVFEHTKGVKEVVSGYAGGKAENANYEQVSSGNTGHAEAVKVTYDPNLVSLDQLLDIYFTVAHNPTQLNYQGPDHGTQYRSEIFYNEPQQKAAAEQKIASLTSEKPVVTKLEPLQAFYPAEDYHQDFASLHPFHPYILMHDRPKVSALEAQFPDLYRE